MKASAHASTFYNDLWSSGCRNWLIIVCSRSESQSSELWNYVQNLTVCAYVHPPIVEWQLGDLF